MAKIKARKSMKQTLLSGYRHHSHEKSTLLFDRYLECGGELPDMGLTLHTYADILAPEPFRAMQNSAICLTTVVSRSAIEHGVDIEQSFALSDYYIYEVELQKDETQLMNLSLEIMEHFAELVKQEQFRSYSLPVTRAIRHIRRKLYEACTVSEIATHVHLHPQYFATLFKKETGISPSAFIRQTKMEEARELLHIGHAVADVADMLSYCTSSHFIQEFRKTFGITPKQLQKAVPLEASKPEAYVDSPASRPTIKQAYFL